ncbi:MAG: hypothetical protein IKV57_06045 [Clostridia bacterium]|nr:hypothetical protein [Clostridia bacterium]
MKAKRWIAFLCAVVVLQGLMLLFCSAAGLMTLYPLLFRVSDEEYQTKGTFTVYYDMRLPAAEADFVVVGMDFGVTQSYDAFQHLFRFLKQYKNITTIYLDSDEDWAEKIHARMEDPMIDPGLPQVLLSFADTLSAINNIQPPQKKCTVEAWQTTGIDPQGNLILMDKDAMMAERETLEAAGALCVEMKYVNCQTESGIRTDIPLPLAGEDVRYSFLAASRIRWFYDYYRTVTNMFSLPSMEETAEKLDGISADFVICIANGTPAALAE